MPSTDVRVPAAIVVNVPNTDVIEVAEIEPPDIVAAVANRLVVKLAYADVTVLAANVV